MRRPFEERHSENAEALMCDRTGLVTLVAMIGFVLVSDPGVGCAQIEGAVQYPPASIGEDAQPPAAGADGAEDPIAPTARIGNRGSSLALTNPLFQIREGADRLPMQPAPHSGASALLCRAAPRHHVPATARGGKQEDDAACNRCPAGYDGERQLFGVTERCGPDLQWR